MRLAEVWRGGAHIARAAAAIALIGPVLEEERQRGWLTSTGAGGDADAGRAADLGIGSSHSAVGDQDLAREILGHPADRFCASRSSRSAPGRPAAAADRAVQPPAVRPRSSTAAAGRRRLTARRAALASQAMLIGKAGTPVSHICQAYPDRVEVRGRDLCGDLMGRLSFTSTSTCCSRGGADRRPARLPRPPAHLDRRARDDADQRRRADDARRRPGSLQGAVAAGILGCGPVVLGTAELCAQLLEEAQASRRDGEAPEAVTSEMALAIRAPAARRPASDIPCTGRSTPAPSGSSSWPTRAALRARTSRSRASFRDAVAEAWGRPLTMNVSMPIAAVMLDLGFPAATAKAVPLAGPHGEPARAPGRGAGGSRSAS